VQRGATHVARGDAGGAGDEDVLAPVARLERLHDVAQRERLARARTAREEEALARADGVHCAALLFVEKARLEKRALLIGGRAPWARTASAAAIVQALVREMCWVPQMLEPALNPTVSP